MVIYAPIAATLFVIFFITHHYLFHSRLNTFFCKSFLLRPDYMILQTFTVTSSIGCFYSLVFLFYNF